MIRRALLCGINTYKSVTALRGCIRDVEDMKALLRNVYQFRDEDIRVLKDSEVVKTALKGAWKWLLTGAGPGDTLVFHFSGHGSFVPDQEGEDEDGNDELLCLYDMDFNNRKTYLLDDEFDVMTRKKPDGANLVIITDCCHSGTNTRMVMAEVNGVMLPAAVDERATFALAREFNSAPEAVEVGVRFLPPPDYLPSREPVLRRQPFAEPAELNHLHLAACQDNETAKDAPFAGNYHGAFTYHLCRTLEADPHLGSTDLITCLTRILTASPFFQNPRANGAPRNGPFFGAAAAAPPPLPPPVAPARPPGDTLREETARELIGALRNLTTALTRRPQPVPRPSRAVGRRILVYVHGIDEHPGDFSLPCWQALSDHVGDVFGAGELDDTRVNVHWSDIVNDRGLARNLSGAGSEAALAKRLIEKEMQERSARFAAPGQRTVQPPRQQTLQSRGGGPQIDDFLRYLFQASTRQAILDRFKEKVRPRLAAGEVLDIISHSWGTVVAYEGLLQLESEGVLGDVANLFTVGAALSFSLIRWQLDLGGVRPAQVRRWLNLDAKGDSVGGAIGDTFPIDREYLDLEPTGCSRGFFGYNVSCAHSSYFRADNLSVNRDIFALHILEG